MAVQGYYYGDSGSGELPSAEAVLSKLKSDGTFDQIRKLCVAAVQEEPSYRAQKEHVEIISRRFLHNYRWKESTTKNEVRSKLRSFVLEEMKKPGVHVGASLDTLIDRALETKATDLLPTIKAVVEAMLQPTPPGNETRAAELGTSHSSTSSSMGPTVTTATSGSGQGSTAGSLELPIHLLEFSSIPTRKEVSTGPRSTKVRPRLPPAAEKRDSGGSGGKMSVPASSSGRSSSREERQETLPAGVKEKHLQRESKRADNKSQSETEKEREKEKRGEPLATSTGKQTTHEKTEAMHKATATGSRRMEKDGASFDTDVNEVVNSRDILSENKATDGGGKRRKRRASQRDDNQPYQSEKPHVSAATRRPTWKRRAALSSTSEEEEESCEEEPTSSSDLEVQTSDSGERKGRPSHRNDHQKSNLKRVKERVRVQGQTTVRDCSVVITRYNRRVKPNRRYVSSDLYQHEEEYMDNKEENEEDKEEENDEDNEDEDNEESEEEEEENRWNRENLEEKGQLLERENSTTNQEQPVAKRLRSRK